MSIRTIDDLIREELQDPEFAVRYAEAKEEWTLAIQIARLRREKGLTQEQLAEMVGTKQQNIARIENPDYSGHSLSLLRRVAHALGTVAQVRFVPAEQVIAEELGEDRKPAPTVYRIRKPAGTSVKKATVVRETPPD